jgi:hypothetical protein
MDFQGSLLDFNYCLAIKETEIEKIKDCLKTILGYCDSLSNEELTHIFVVLAKDVPTSGRVNFLDKIISCTGNRYPGSKSKVLPLRL